MEDKIRQDGISWDGHFIGDKTRFKAVCFTLHLLQEGETMLKALEISAGYHKIPVSDVAVEIMVDRFIKKSDQT